MRVGRRGAAAGRSECESCDAISADRHLSRSRLGCERHPRRTVSAVTQERLLSRDGRGALRRFNVRHSEHLSEPECVGRMPRQSAQVHDP